MTVVYSWYIKQLSREGATASFNIHNNDILGNSMDKVSEISKVFVCWCRLYGITTELDLAIDGICLLLFTRNPPQVTTTFLSSYEVRISR